MLLDLVYPLPVSTDVIHGSRGDTLMGKDIMCDISGSHYVILFFCIIRHP